jgi:hypothetical protein
MSNTQHQAIVEAVAALLTTAPSLAGGYVFEGRDLALGSDVPSQIHVFLNDSNPDGEILTGAPMDWSSEISIVIRARKAGSDSAEKVADALLFDAWSRVMADQSLSGLVMQLTAGPVTRDRDPADPDVAAFTWTFTVAHRTTNNSLA